MRFSLSQRRVNCISSSLRQLSCVVRFLHAQQPATMPAAMKRKRNGASDSPSTVEPARRRSARNQHAFKEESAEPTALGVLYANGEGERRPRAERTNSRESKQDVQRAMRNLQDMENSLQSATKKQQQAVDTSDLSVDLDEVTSTDTTVPIVPSQPPRPGKKEVVNDHTEESGSIEQAPLSNHDAEIAEGDLAAEPMDDVEMGARRPPPVNSDTLPLPWTGRLGYVRSEDPGSSHGQPAGLAQTTKTEELTENRDLGMPKHLFESFEPAGILLQDLSHELHH